jgi:hypothetical protein
VVKLAVIELVWLVCYHSIVISDIGDNYEYFDIGELTRGPAIVAAVVRAHEAVVRLDEQAQRALWRHPELQVS